MFAEESDVDLLRVGEEPKVTHVNGSHVSLSTTGSSCQPIVHFEGGVHEPIGPRDFTYTTQQDSAKR